MDQEQSGMMNLTPEYQNGPHGSAGKDGAELEAAVCKAHLKGFSVKQREEYAVKEGSLFF